MYTYNIYKPLLCYLTIIKILNIYNRKKQQKPQLWCFNLTFDPMHFKKNVDIFANIKISYILFDPH